MIWSDMYITANTNGGYYEVPADADCSSWEKPEKGLGLVYWIITMMMRNLMKKC